MKELTKTDSDQYAKDLHRIFNSLQYETSFGTGDCIEIATELMKAHIIANGGKING